MKISIVFSLLLMFSLLSCKKTAGLDPSVDNTVNWVGTFNDPVLGAPYVINKAVVTKVNNTTVQMMLIINNYGTFDTFALLKEVKLRPGNAAAINEKAMVSGDTANYNFTGNASLDRDTLIASGTGVNINDQYDQQVFFFVGIK